MRTILLILASWGMLWSMLAGGLIRIDPSCSPKQIQIQILDDQGKSLIDHTLVDPQNGTPLKIALDSSKKYHYKITAEPENVLCLFTGSTGNELDLNADLVCHCKGAAAADPKQGKINLLPGKWLLTSSYRSVHFPVYMPTPSETLCVKDPQSELGMEVIAEIKATDCPYTMKQEGYEFGEWRRQGHNCDIHGKVHYLGDRMEAEIFYKRLQKGTTAVYLYIHGKRIGDCE